MFQINSVYGDNKLMRLVYNHKFNDNRISQPIDNLKINYKDTLIEIKPENFKKMLAGDCDIANY
jgi:hypothetical protein